jgi:serine/threonine-protein kinase mTOR
LRRLQGCQPDVEVWQRIIQIRSQVVLSPGDEPLMWIKFSNLCRKNDRMVLAEKTINSLLSPDKVSRTVIEQNIYTCIDRIKGSTFT